MKKLFVLMMLLAFLFPMQSHAGPSYTLPDGTVCAHMFDQLNDFGGWSGRYLCATPDDEVYYGWGPAASDPPALLEDP